MNLRVLVSFFVLSFSFFAMSKEDCATCTKTSLDEAVKPDKKVVIELKNAVGVPLSLAKKSPLVITKNSAGRAPAGERAVSPKSDYQESFCMQYEMAQDTVDVETIMEKIEACPYSSSFNEFWITPACHAPRKNDTNVPIIFNTATDVYRMVDFPKTIYEYFVEERKDPKLWLLAINTKTSDGYTFLDYLHYNFLRGNYASGPLTDAANRIIAYVCAHGGEYSKYKDSKSCQVK